MTQGLSFENQVSADLRAQHYLLNDFGLKKIVEGKRLPTAKYLAQQAGVSTKALCIALSIFEEQGLITITKAGTFRGQKQKRNDTHPALALRTLRKGERILEQMRNDIRNGRFPEGEALPDMQKLSEIYNVSRPTLIKSLTVLLKEEVLLRHLASYIVPRPKRIFPSAAVLVVCTQTLSGSPALSGQRASQLLSRMQWECRERMLHLEITSYGEHEPALAFPQRINLVHHRPAFMGYVVIASYMGDSGVRAVLKELAPYKKPIALIDELGKLTIPEK